MLPVHICFRGTPEKDSTRFPDFGVLLDFGALKIEAQKATSKIGVLVKRFGLEG